MELIEAIIEEARSIIVSSIQVLIMIIITKPLIEAGIISAEPVGTAISILIATNIGVKPLLLLLQHGSK